MNKLIRLALNNRLLVVAMAAFAMVYGALAIKQIPVDVFPDLNRPVVTILTEASGMAPEEVETLVTLPMESALAGMPGVERVRSSSGVTLSIIFVEFDWGTDIYRNRQLVAERLSRVQSQLPEGIVPKIGPITSLLGEIQLVGLTAESEDLSPVELRTTADWIVRPRMQAVPGVANVLVIGGDIREYQILISLEKLKYYQITLEDLEDALEHLSQNTTGGFLTRNKKEYLVRNIGAVESIEDIENSMVGMHFGNPVLVKDIAEVRLGGRLNKRGEASVNLKPAVLLSIVKQPGVSTIDLTKAVDEALMELAETLPPTMSLERELFRQSNFIQHSIDNVKEVLRDGVILVSIVLFLFLLNFRTTIISLTAIPLSFVLTFIVFKFWGLTINTMTLGGLAIAIGELVDDAIVDVENVFRRLKQNRQRANPLPMLKVVYDASCEIRGSIVFATLIVVLVFAPLFHLSGLEGRLFIPLGLAYIISLTASLLVSLTVTPVLCSYLLGGAKVMDEKPSRLVVVLQAFQEKVLNRALDWPKTTLGLSTAIFLGTVALIPLLGTSFLPPFQEGTAMISVLAKPGISLKASDELGRKAEEIIQQIPEVKYTSRKTGRAAEDEHAEGVHTSEIDVDFIEGGRSRFEVLEEIRERLEANLDGVFLNIGQPISHKIDHMMSGINSQIAIKLYGPDLGTLRRKATEIYRAIKDTEGLVDLQVERQTRVPESKIYLMREDAAKHGLILGNLTHSLETALNGTVVAQVLEDQRYSDVVVRLDDRSRANLDLIASMPVRIKPDGSQVLLKDVADVYNSKGPNLIQREHGKRRIAIHANASGRDIGSIMKDVDAKIEEKIKLPTGYFIEYDGQYKSQVQAMRAIAIMSCFSLLIIFAVLYSHFASGHLALQVMVTIPLAVIGAVLGLYLTGIDLSIATLIGFITLCGIASRNAIMMISHFLHLIKEEGEAFTRSMVVRGAKERLIPVLMTSLTAILGLIPLALSAGEPGREILHPLSIVIIGGLISSTLFDIIITPTIFYHYGERAAAVALKPKEKL